MGHSHQYGLHWLQGRRWSSRRSSPVSDTFLYLELPSLPRARVIPRPGSRFLGLNHVIPPTLLGSDSMSSSALSPLSPPSRLQFCFSPRCSHTLFFYLSIFPTFLLIVVVPALSWSAFLGWGGSGGLAFFVSSSCFYAWTSHCLLLLSWLPLVRPLVTSRDLPLMI